MQHEDKKQSLPEPTSVPHGSANNHPLSFLNGTQPPWFFA
jgi:hypothetical protein